MDTPKRASPDCVVHRIGAEERPVIVIENFLPDPRALRMEAQNAAFRSHIRFFPGIQAPFPFARMNELIAPHREIIADNFLAARSHTLIECGFALVTTPASQLMPLQRIPHIDTTDPGRLAILAYVSGMQFGGTAFYRHKSTGYEYIDQSRNSAYNSALDRDVESFGLPAAEYICSDTDIFERIAKFDAKPGRAIIYASNSLHSGWIQNSEHLSASASEGRLTLNAFLVDSDP